MQRGGETRRVWGNEIKLRILDVVRTKRGTLAVVTAVNEDGEAAEIARSYTTWTVAQSIAEAITRAEEGK